MYIYCSVKIMPLKGIAFPMLYLIRHSRGFSKLPKPSPGLPTVLGRMPDCLSRSWRSRHQEEQRASAPGPCCRTFLCCRQPTHFATRSYRDDVLQERYTSARRDAGEPWEILQRGKDTFLLENHLYFLVFSFYHL